MARMWSRRRTPRYSLIAVAEAVDVESGLRLDARIAHMSLTGCYLATTNPLLLGRRVKLQLTHGDRTIEIHGAVVRSETNTGMRISFTDLDANHLAILEKWFAELG